MKTIALSKLFTFCYIKCKACIFENIFKILLYSSHIFFVVSTGFFSSCILIVLNFWSARKSCQQKKCWRDTMILLFTLATMLAFAKCRCELERLQSVSLLYFFVACNFYSMVCPIYWCFAFFSIVTSKCNLLTTSRATWHGMFVKHRYLSWLWDGRVVVLFSWR